MASPSDAKQSGPHKEPYSLVKLLLIGDSVSGCGADDWNQSVTACMVLT